MRITFLERNVIKKNYRRCPLKIALCYPGPYRVAVCSLAYQMLYQILNREEDVICERFCIEDWNYEPRSLESLRPLRDFDIIIFTIPYEIQYLDALRILVNANISLDPKSRRQIIFYGGITAFENPIPLIPIFDVACIGDLEVLIPKLLRVLREEFLPNHDKDRVIHALNEVNGFLTLPKVIDGIKVRKVIKRRLGETFRPVTQFMPIQPPSKSLEPIYGASYLLEISRGCFYQCNFCLLSHVYNPYREKSYDLIIDEVKCGLERTRARKICIIASAYRNINMLKDLLYFIVEELKLEVSMPSLRIDRVDKELLRLLKLGGQRTLTLAPETFSENLKTFLNKNIPNDLLYKVAYEAFNVGFKQIKLYLMFGFPKHTFDDLTDLVRGLETLRKIGFKHREAIRLTLTPLIPKPHTPFQWLPLAREEELKRYVRILRIKLKHFGIRLNFLNPHEAKIEAILAKGDINISKILVRLASSEDRPTLSLILKELKPHKLYEDIHKAIDVDMELPWDIIDVGVSKADLKKRYYKAISYLD